MNSKLELLNSQSGMLLSEEMLGAYVEGNLDIHEEAEVENLINSDDELDSLVDDVITDSDWHDADSVYIPELPEDFQLPMTDLNDSPFSSEDDDVVVEDVIVGDFEGGDETPGVTDDWNGMGPGFVDDFESSIEIGDDVM